MAAQPGHTKDLQSIQLERGIKVVDSPGVVFDEDDVVDGKGGKKGSVLLRNVVKVEDIDDPIVVGKIYCFVLCEKCLLMIIYSRRDTLPNGTRSAAKDI